MFDFSKKVLWLTGANGAISRAIASTFFELGATCVLTDLDAEGIGAFADSLDPSGDRAIGLKQDASLAADAERVAGEINERFGRLDFLVTSAGLYVEGAVKDLTDAKWQRGIAVNLDGVLFATRAAIPLLAMGGAIVHVASMAGHRGSVNHAAYAAAKGAVLTLSRTLALELAPTVRVNAVSPGLIDTPMVQPLIVKQGPALIAMTPLKRLGTPDEVAKTVAFLCSDWASYITGETVHINGGLYIAS